jgi:hypothetical protein
MSVLQTEYVGTITKLGDLGWSCSSRVLEGFVMNENAERRFDSIAALWEAWRVRREERSDRRRTG